jgi:hypothetical protein
MWTRISPFDSLHIADLGDVAMVPWREMIETNDRIL